MQWKLLSRFWGQPSQNFRFSESVESLFTIKAEQVCFQVCWILARLCSRRVLDSLFARCVQCVRHQMALVKLLLLQAQLALSYHGFKAPRCWSTTAVRSLSIAALTCRSLPIFSTS